MLLTVSSIACALAYTAFAILLALHSRRTRAVAALVLASSTTALWALAVPAGDWLEGRIPGALEAIDVLRISAWLIFLAVAVRPGADMRPRPWLGSALGVVLAGIVGLLIWSALRLGSPVALARVGTFEPAAHLALAIAGLVWIEALLRRARAEGHDRTRYLCLGIGALLAFDVVSWSQTLLFHHADASLLALTPAVHLLAAPLLGLGAARNQAFATELNLARRAVLHSATFFALGAYLLALSGVGLLLRHTGGQWGPSLQILSFCAGFLALAFVWASPSLRAALRFGLGRYLFTHRHDYREQWERFAMALSGPEGTAGRAAQALRALADVMGSLWGALWLRDGEAFELAASQGISAAAIDRLGDGPLTSWIEGLGSEVSEIAEAGQLPPQLGWAWIVVPLVRERLVGFVMLSRPRGRQALHAEDAELLRIAGLHAASALLADQRARRLGEVQRFEEVSRGLAFVAHDLRNLANELTLTLANARRHIASPDFQRDLLLTMEDSVQSMQRLLDKVARRRREIPDPEPIDLAQLVVATVRTRRGVESCLALDHEPSEVLPIAGDPERLAAMSGHLIQNAIDAAGARGHVRVRLRRSGETAVLEVEDDGPGMAPALLRDRLLHPFQSSKPDGFGLGLFECREVARELGGELAVESEPGRGTAARLRLPLAKSEAPGRESTRAGG